MQDLQESCYLLLYDHVRRSIRHKDLAQTKIRRWWVMINQIHQVETKSTLIPIVRGVSFPNRSSTFDVHQLLITCPGERKIACHSPKYEYMIQFQTNREFKLYLLRLFVRSNSVTLFRADVNEFLQTFEQVTGFCVHETVF